MDAKKIKFDDMPTMMSTILSEVKELRTQVDTINKIVTNKKEENKSRVLGIEEVSKIMHKSTSTIYKMVAQNRIPCYKQGKTLTFFENEILEWMSQFKRGSATEMMALAEQYLQRLQ